PESAIRKITNAAGFQYAYDIATNQFAHGTVLLVTTADGRLSRYLFGFEYKPRDLRLALVEASQGKIGGAAEQILLLCFHYDPATGKYSRSAMNFVRAGGVATVLGLGSFIAIMIRRERQLASSVLLPQGGRRCREAADEGVPTTLTRPFGPPSPASRERDAGGSE